MNITSSNTGIQGYSPISAFDGLAPSPRPELTPKTQPERLAPDGGLSRVRPGGGLHLETGLPDSPEEWWDMTTKNFLKTLESNPSGGMVSLAANAVAAFIRTHSS